MGNSGEDTNGMKVGPDPLSLHPYCRLARDYPIVRDSPAEPPHRDPRLFHRLPGHDGQLVGKRGLATCCSDDRLYTDNERVLSVIDGNLVGLGGHIRPAFNTESVIDVNTRSVFPETHNAHMARNGETSEFWKRLTLARTSCSPPKSMVQEDIARDYRVAGQSTVTKWKTGKGKPTHDVLERMALDANVNINWLWAGQGDMRPLPVTDPVTRRVVEVLNTYSDQGERLKILEAALLQKAATPQVAQILKEAQAEAKEASADSLAPRPRRRR